MSKRVEQYIKEHTRDYTNYTGCIEKKTYKNICYSWLTPDEARAVAKIAREEVMVDVFYHLEVRLPEHLDYNGIVVERKQFIEDFKKVLMEDSV